MISIHTAKKYLLLPLFGLLFVSCLNSSQQGQVQDRLILTLNFSNINDDIAAANDTINIVSLDFLVGATTLQSNNNDTLQIVENAFQISHQLGNGNETKEIALGTFNSEAIFNRLTFEIKQAEQSDIGGDSNINGDMFIEGESEDERYSMIISGSYNGEQFEFKSTRNFNFVFPFEDNSGGNQGGLLYNLPLETDVREWFLNAENEGLLDPGEPANATAINDNIESSVIIN